MASALITASFAACGGAGFTHAMLSVDRESPTGANRLCERLGFRVLSRTVTMQLEA